MFTGEQLKAGAKVLKDMTEEQLAQYDWSQMGADALAQLPTELQDKIGKLSKVCVFVCVCARVCVPVYSVVLLCVGVISVELFFDVCSIYCVGTMLMCFLAASPALKRTHHCDLSVRHHLQTGGVQAKSG